MTNRHNAFIKEGHFVCECGREFTKSQSLYAHQSTCKVHLGDRYDPEKHKGWNNGSARAWNKGLTKETDPRVLAISVKLSNTLKGKPGHKHTEESKKKMSIAAKHNAKNHINGWKAGNNRIPNKYELFTKDFLEKHNITYASEVVVPQSKLGKKGSYYQLDFLVNDSIDLEIDGSSHDPEYDAIRDSYMSKIYSVYRINHGDSMDELETQLIKFLDTLK